MRLGTSDPDPAAVRLRAPGVGDAAALWTLARQAGGLDVHAPYAYVLLCHAFAGTCAVAEGPEGAVGFLTAFRLPDESSCLFVWQVAVLPARRRQGWAGRMLRHVLARPGCADIRCVEATVTPGNCASRALFAGLAAELGAPLRTEEGFPRSLFPGGRHEPESRIRVGPWTPRS